MTKLVKTCMIKHLLKLCVDSKTHKLVINNLPKFRPILSAINNLGFNMAQFLIPILESLTHKEFLIKHSFGFAKEIATYDNSLYFAILKLSLYSRKFHQMKKSRTVLAIYVIKVYIMKNSTINKRDLFKLLETTTNEFSSIFDYLLNKQIARVVMDSPLGLTLANVFFVIMKKNGWIIT